MPHFLKLFALIWIVLQFLGLGCIAHGNLSEGEFGLEFRPEVHGKFQIELDVNVSDRPMRDPGGDQPTVPTDPGGPVVDGSPAAMRETRDEVSGEGQR